MTVILVVLSIVLGGVIGSFANVAIYRVPRGESVVSPPSHCPNCDAPIRARHNVPVLGWLVLRGKCHDCGNPISARYPLVEAGMALAFGGVALVLAPAVAESVTAAAAVAAVLVLVAYLYLAAISIILTLIDLDVRRLPNTIVLPAYAVGVVLLGVAALLGGDLVPIARAAAGAGILFAVYFVAAVAYPGGMGFGDVKLAGVLGLFLGWVGWGALAVGAFSAFLLGGLFAVVMMVLKRAGRKSSIPFGPWMLLGAWVGIVFGQIIFDSYLGLFGFSA